MSQIQLNISQSRDIADETKELVNIISNEQGQQTIAGRELHRALRVKQEFTHWIKKQLGMVGAIEGEDYNVIWYKDDDAFQDVVEFNGNVKSMNRQGFLQDYILTLEIAKEICMVVGAASRTNEETRRLSKQVRKYFLKCEEIAKEKIFQQRLDQEVQKVKRNEVVKLPIAFYSDTLKQMLSELEGPKDYFDTVLPQKAYRVSEVAEDYGMSAQVLNKKLEELGIQYRKSSGWLLHEPYHGKGYTMLVMYVTIPVDGEADLSPYMYWTLKGRLFIYEELKKVGILPLMERGN